MRELKKNKKSEGITLIALVVTIVVLLILAGVSISMLVGENGIIKQAQEAKEETRGGTVEEARDLWKSNIKLDKTTGGETAQNLNQVLNDLISQGQLTEKEKDQIVGNNEKGITATGKVTIGRRTIDFGNIELYPSIRFGPIGSSSMGEIGLVCHIPDFSKEEIEREYSSFYTLTVSEKEKALSDTLLFLVKDVLGEEVTTLKEVLNKITGNNNINTWQDAYEWFKETNNLEDLNINNYEEFLIAEFEEYVFNKEYIKNTIILDFTIIKPDGTTISNSTYNNVIELPISEYGTYKIVVKSLYGGYIGTSTIEYTNNKYVMTYGGYEKSDGLVYETYCGLYDTELHQIVEVDKAYIYANGTKKDVSNRMNDGKDFMAPNKIELYWLSETPFELEFVKDGQSIKNYIFRAFRQE